MEEELRLAKEQTEVVNRVKSQMLSGISHELRTPVARIRFGMEMLAEDDDYDSRLSQVDMIDKDIEALNTLIDEIMTYAKLEQGTPSLDIQSIPIADVLAQVAKETEALKTQKIIELNAPDRKSTRLNSSH